MINLDLKKLTVIKKILLKAKLKLLSTENLMITSFLKLLFLTMKLKMDISHLI